MRALLTVVFLWMLSSAVAADPSSVRWQVTNAGPEINSEYHEAFSTITADGLTLYVSSSRPGGFGKADLEDPWPAASYDIYITRRTSPEAPWGPLVNLGPNINTEHSEHSVTFSPDGHWMYFASDRPDLGACGGLDILVSYRADVADDLGWERPVNLGCRVNGPFIDSCPIYVVEGNKAWMYFAKSTSPHPLTIDFVVSRHRTGKNRFTTPKTVKISGDRGDAHLDPFHGLIWGIDYRGGFGGSDLWVSTAKSAQGNPVKKWTTPVNLGNSINTPHEEHMPSANEDGSLMFFMSNRPGGHGGMDIYEASRVP